MSCTCKFLHTQCSRSIFAGKMKDTFALTHYFFSTHAIPYVITPKHKIQVIHYSDEDFAKICSFN